MMLACDKNPKIRDNTPEIRPAGKLLPRGHGTKECLDFPPSSLEGGRVTPDLVRRIRGVIRPEVGQRWEAIRRTGDLPVDPDIAHGVQTLSSLKARHLVNPALKTKFQQANLGHKEAHYFSNRRMPLGKSQDQSAGLPKGLNPLETRFGRPVDRDISIDEVIAPNKSAKDIEEEFEEGKELYKKSHNDWDVGEIIDRNYDWSKFTKDTLYGMENPHDNTGGLVRTTLNWAHNTENVKVISKQLDDFREKSQPQFATVHDPLVDTLDVPPGHTFGITVPVDRFGAGDLIHKEFPTTFSDCETLDEGALASVRSHLKKGKFYSFDCLLAALQHNDKENKGVVPANIVHDIAFQFRVPLTFDMLEMLVRWTTKDEGCVAYEELVALLNWRNPLDEAKLTEIASYTTQPATPPCKSPVTGQSSPSRLKVLSDYTTSSQAYKAGTGDISTQHYRVYGVPTIRADLAAPRIKRVGDSKNYGDEADSGGLMYPSIYSNHGVYPEDFFRPYPPEKIREIFKCIGVEMSDEAFGELWELAAKRDPKGEVCVESFRAVAEELHKKELVAQDQLHQEERAALWKTTV